MHHDDNDDDEADMQSPFLDAQDDVESLVTDHGGNNHILYILVTWILSFKLKVYALFRP